MVPRRISARSHVGKPAYIEEVIHQRPLHAVTFDCWGTLIYERDRHSGARMREELFGRTLREHGIETTDEETTTALNQAWRRHWQEWLAGVSTDAIDIARWGLEAFGIEERELAERLGHGLQEVALGQEVIALEGAGETLERLAQRDVKRALICDTGFSPARVVRQLLQREGLLEYLEVQIFSDEAGVPKPNPRVFHAALGQLEVAPRHALHVGDLRRTDIAGARAVGMGSVRIRWQHDDPSELPDAEQVADSHAHLQEILGIHDDQDEDGEKPKEGDF